eukprot:scaffold115_cov304-Prasinococcus_capsulatus_cf.AAC.24
MVAPIPSSGGKRLTTLAYISVFLLLLFRLQYLERSAEVDSLTVPAQKVQWKPKHKRSYPRSCLPSRVRLQEALAQTFQGVTLEVTSLSTTTGSTPTKSGSARASAAANRGKGRPKAIPTRAPVGARASNIDVNAIVAIGRTRGPDSGDRAAEEGSVHILLEEDDSTQADTIPPINAQRARKRQTRPTQPGRPRSAATVHAQEGEGGPSHTTEPDPTDTRGNHRGWVSGVFSFMDTVRGKSTASLPTHYDSDAGSGGSVGQLADSWGSSTITTTISVPVKDMKYLHENLTLEEVVQEMGNRKGDSKGGGLLLAREQFATHKTGGLKSSARSWLEYFDGQEKVRYSFDKKLVDLLPAKEPTFHFGTAQYPMQTCAIVGNSGVVLFKDNGKRIDEHSAVFRINLAPVRGYETYVGRRTDFNIVNAHNIRELLTGNRKYLPDPEGPSRLVMFETASEPARKNLCEPLLKRFSRAKPILLSPSFANQCHKKWIQLKYLLELTLHKAVGEFHRKPMSGFFATCLALQICDSVDLFGFDSYLGSKTSYKYHYFDDVKGFTGRHSFDLAMSIFRNYCIIARDKLVLVLVNGNTVLAPAESAVAQGRPQLEHCSTASSTLVSAAIYESFLAVSRRDPFERFCNGTYPL